MLWRYQKYGSNWKNVTSIFNVYITLLNCQFSGNLEYLENDSEGLLVCFNSPPPSSSPTVLQVHLGWLLAQHHKLGELRLLMFAFHDGSRGRQIRQIFCLLMYFFIYLLVKRKHNNTTTFILYITKISDKYVSVEFVESSKYKVLIWMTLWWWTCFELRVCLALFRR